MSVEQYLQAILDELRTESDGHTYPIKFTMASGSPMVTIDFLDGSAKVARPDDLFTSNIEVPQKPLFSLQIKNYGPGALNFATNRPCSSSEAEGSVDVMESITLDFHKPRIKRLNLLPVGGAVTVRLICLI